MTPAQTARHASATSGAFGVRPCWRASTFAPTKSPTFSYCAAAAACEADVTIMRLHQGQTHRRQGTNVSDQFTCWPGRSAAGAPAEAAAGCEASWWASLSEGRRRPLRLCRGSPVPSTRGDKLGAGRRAQIEAGREPSRSTHGECSSIPVRPGLRSLSETASCRRHLPQPQPASMTRPRPGNVQRPPAGAATAPPPLR